MGQYFSLVGPVQLSPAAYERAREVRLDDGRPAGKLMDHFGPCPYHAGEQRLTMALSTKRGHLFEGLVRVLAHVKDVEGIDDLDYEAEYSRGLALMYQLRPGAYRMVGEGGRLSYNLHREDGWQPVPVLAMALRMSEEEVEMEVLGWFGVRRTIPLWEAGMPEELLGATQEQLDRFELSSAGTEVEWPGVEAKSGGTVMVDLGDVDGWGETEQQTVE